MSGRGRTGAEVLINTGLTGANSLRSLVSLACDEPRAMQLRIIADEPATLSDWTDLVMTAVVIWGVDGASFREEIPIGFRGLVVTRFATSMEVSVRVDNQANVPSTAQRVRAAILADPPPRPALPEQCVGRSILATAFTDEPVPDWASFCWLAFASGNITIEFLAPNNAVVIAVNTTTGRISNFPVPSQAVTARIQNAGAGTAVAAIGWGIN